MLYRKSVAQMVTYCTGTVLLEVADLLVPSTGSGSGSRSFYHQANIRKTLIPTVLWQNLWLHIFEKWSKCSFKKSSNKQKTLENKKFFSCHLEGHWRKIAGSVFNLVCGSGSGFGIRIRIQEGKMTHKTRQ